MTGGRRSSRIAGIVLCVLAASAQLATATWSIVLTNRATGEIGVAQATCIVGPDLRESLAVVVPGWGGACVQAWWDTDGSRRQVIWDQFHAGAAPDQILQELEKLGEYERYQFGIVDLDGRAATHTGNTAGDWAGGLTGSSGDLAWAIQGNVLAGREVVAEAQKAIVNTPGDVATKLLAGMLAAASFGGDGRCSCNFNDPDSCGSPPPGFDLSTGKSAHVGFLMVSRQGEREGRCNPRVGCANGSEYYLALDVTPGQDGLPDPIVEIQGRFQQWDAAQSGRPDHLNSVLSLADPSLPGNGNSRTTLSIALVDRHGVPLGHGGAALRVRHADESAHLSRIGDPVDHGDGTYHVPITAGEGQGKDVLRVFVDDGQGEILLWPPAALELRSTLTSDVDRLSAAQGGTVRLGLEGPLEGPPPREYLLLGSLSGTDPGLPIGSTVLPLNLDSFLLLSFVLRNGANFVDTAGTLGADGQGEAFFTVPSGVLTPLIGLELAFAYATADSFDFASNAVRVVIDP